MKKILFFLVVFTLTSVAYGQKPLRVVTSSQSPRYKASARVADTLGVDKILAVDTIIPNYDAGVIFKSAVTLQSTCRVSGVFTAAGAANFLSTVNFYTKTTGTSDTIAVIEGNQIKYRVGWDSTDYSDTAGYARNSLKLNGKLDTAFISTTGDNGYGTYYLTTLWTNNFNLRTKSNSASDTIAVLDGNNLKYRMASTLLDTTDYVRVYTNQTKVGNLTITDTTKATKAVKSPYLIGGEATTSDLTLQTTTAAGTTGADMHFLVGNNGGTEALIIKNNGVTETTDTLKSKGVLYVPSTGQSIFSTSSSSYGIQLISHPTDNVLRMNLFADASGYLKMGTNNSGLSIWSNLTATSGNHLFTIRNDGRASFCNTTAGGYNGWAFYQNTISAQDRAYFQNTYTGVNTGSHWGLYSESSGTNSGTNIGGTFTASGGAIKNIALQTLAGNTEFVDTTKITKAIKSPYLIGGDATTSDLYLQTTTAAGTTGADMHFLVGNNGATEALTLLNSGDIGGVRMKISSTSNYEHTYAGYLSGNNNTLYASTLYGSYSGQSNTGDYVIGIGVGALQNNSGYGTLAIGSNAANHCSGNNNIGIGQLALDYNSGDYNFGIGEYSNSYNSGNYNFGFGQYSLRRNTGSYNEGLGYVSLDSNSGNNNIGLGGGTGRRNSGSNCIFIGNYMGWHNTESNRLFIGYDPTFPSDIYAPLMPLIYGEFDNDKVAINDTIADSTLTVNGGISATTGIRVPLHIGGNLTTSDLTFQTTSANGATGADMHFLVGNNGGTEAFTIENDGDFGGLIMRTSTSDGNYIIGTGTASPSGQRNILIGNSSFSGLTSGGENVGIGEASGSGSTGTQNVFVGRSAGGNATDSYNTGIGSYASYNGTASTIRGTTSIGQQAGYQSFGDYTINIGWNAGYQNKESNRLFIHNNPSGTDFIPAIYGELDTKKIAINDTTVDSTLTVNGGISATTGIRVPLHIGGNLTTSDLTLQTTSANGATGADMHFLVGNNGGTEALTIENDGDFGGYLFRTDASNDNYQMGRFSALAGSCNINIGDYSGGALQSTAFRNILFGHGAGYTITTGDGNTCIGFQAGYYLTTGSNNIYIGNETGVQNQTVARQKSNNIFFGYQAGYNEDSDSRLHIGGTNNTLPLIYGEFDNYKVAINDTIATYDLSFDGQAARTIGMNRNITDTNGFSLTINASAGKSSSNNRNGGNLILRPGLSTGTGKSAITLDRYSRASSTGSSDNVVKNAVVIPSDQIVSDNVATTIFTIPFPADSATYGNGVNGVIHYQVTVKGSDGYQSESGEMTYSGVQYLGVPSTNIGIDHEREALSSGTLAVTPTLAYAAGVWTVQVNCNSSLTSPVVKFDYVLVQGSGGATITNN